jgi:catechol 2,3-dioxygenase-like lactoylglutathione lyase family enzyme
MNHINLPVDDVAGARAFFETWFGFTCIEMKGDGLIAVMHGTDGFVLVLMSTKFNVEAGQAYPSAFHVGFLLPTRHAVEEKHAELMQGGVPVGMGPKNMRGVFGFYFTAPGSILIEISSDVQ